MQKIRSKKLRLKKLTLLLASIGLIEIALANPEGGIVTEGTATIQQTPGFTQIQQTSDKAIIEWKSFNIGANEHTHFQQPNANSVALNRISPEQGPSQIYGKLSANGKIILVNQAGIYFGPTARVDVSGIIAATSNISNAKFLTGKYEFDQPSPYAGTVINQGIIKASDYGLVALIGNNVINDGQIHARLGNVVLASGNKFTLDLYGDQLINFSVEEETSTQGRDQNNQILRDGVTNSGSIIADGGTIRISAKSARNVVDHAINMKGVAEAKSIVERNGEIILLGEGASVKVSGKLMASGKTGGKVRVLSTKKVIIENTAKIEANGDNGGGEILIGGNLKGLGPEPNAEDTLVEKGAVISADALNDGDGGKIIVWSDGFTEAYGQFSAKGGATRGKGGFLETSGHYLNVTDASVNVLAPAGEAGTWLLDPYEITINNAATTNMNTSASPYSPTGTGATLNAGFLGTQLNSASIIVATTSGGTGTGNIIIDDTAGDLSTNWTAGTTLTLQAANSIILNALSPITLDSGQTLSLLAARTTTAGTSVTLNSTINGATSSGGGIVSIIGGTGGVTFNQSMGATNPLASLTVQAVDPGNTFFGTSGDSTPIVIRTTGNMSFTDPSVLNVDTTLESTGIGTTISFGDLLNGGKALTITHSNASNSTNITTFGSGVGTLTSLASLNVTTGTLNTTGTVRTTGAQTYTTSTKTQLNAANSTFSSLDSGDITFTGPIFGVNATTRNLIVNTAGVTAFGGAIPNTNYVTTITTDAPGTTIINGGAMNSSGAQTYNDIVKLGANTTITTTNNSGNGIVTFGSTIDNSTSTPRTLTVSSGSGAINLSGNVGSNASTGALGAMTLNSTGVNTISGTLAAASLSTNTGGSSVLNGGSITTTNNLTIGETVTLGAALTATSTAGNVVFNSSFNNGGFGLTINTAGSSGLILGALSNSGTLTKNGVGTLVLNGNNTYTGDTYVNAGILQVGNGATTGNISSTNVINNGELVFNRSNAVTAAYNISGTGAITKQNSNTLTLTGNNTYSGLTTITTGTLQIGSSGTVGTLGTGDVVNNAALILSRSDNFTVSNAISGTGSLTKQENNIATLTGNNTYSGITTISAGTLQIGNNGTSGTLGTNTVTNNGALLFNRTDTLSVNNTISGTGSLTQAGSGTTSLNGTNNYTGTTNVTNGTLAILNANALGSTPSTTVSSGGALLFDYTGMYSGNTLYLNGDGPSNTGALAVSSGNTLSLSNQIVMQSDTTLGGTGNATLTGDISGGFNLTKVGVGVLTLAGNNTYTGTTHIAAGTLAITHANALGTNSAGTTIQPDGILAIQNVSTNEPIILNGGTVNGSQTATLANTVSLTADSTLTTESTASSLSLNGLIDGAYALNVEGEGDIMMNAAIGSQTPLTQLNSAANITLNNVNIWTSGNQNYQGLFVANGTAAALTSGADISFDQGISGTQLAINGNANDNHFLLKGALTLNNLSVNGISGNDSLTVQSNSPSQLFTVTSSNTGNFSVANNSALFDFSNIGNLTGSVNPDTFIFNNNASLSGTVNGVDNDTNTLSYVNYTTPLILSLNTNTVENNLSQLITTFSHINTLLGNNQSTLVLASNQSATANITNSNAGTLNNSVYFTGMSTLNGNANTSVIFNVETYFNYDTMIGLINNVPFAFVNIPSTHFSGNIINVTPTPPAPQPIITPAADTLIVTVVQPAASGTQFTSHPISSFQPDKVDKISKNLVDLLIEQKELDPLDIHISIE